ncbi:hypothetical protein BDD43_2098 [Mucilaginibacter gracilis]|uniref:Uncharacterized protein n=2 Tax=Mucilaginibacter gracilis TaxID=423350 RepID=A0A495IYZ5_9SPHI|nr:hypothetical protein BDD43_2098 [Mucilaginibacter gracilis]
MGIGTILNFNIEAVNMGQQVPLTLTSVSLNDPMKFKWVVAGLGNGSFLIPVKALESGTKMTIKVPESDRATIYKDDETILFISKAALADLVKDQSFTMNKTKFTVKPLDTPYLINNKEADVIYATTDNGKVEVWILNNPNFPLLCKMKGNPAGIDFNLTGFKE